MKELKLTNSQENMILFVGTAVVLFTVFWSVGKLAEQNKNLENDK